MKTINKHNVTGFIVGVLLTLVTVLMQSRVVSSVDELSYTSTKFVPQANGYNFELMGGMGDAFGTWVMYFKGSFNDVELKEKITPKDGCKFAMKLQYENAVFSYEIADWAKEEYVLSESEKCVLHYATELDLLIAEKVKNLATHS